MHTEQYDQGYIAGEAGATSSFNPYNYSSREWYEWQAGWSAAKEDFDNAYYSTEECYGLLWIGFIIVLSLVILTIGSKLGWW